jgi:hypothetical protein
MATCSSCVSTYQTCVTNNPYNWQSCLNTYNSCLGGCSWEGAKPQAAVAAAPKSMVSCSSCTTNYNTCVYYNPNDWHSCVTTYNYCVMDCGWEGAKPVSAVAAAPKTLATCSSCVSTYQTCVTNNPYDW